MYLKWSGGVEWVNISGVVGESMNGVGWERNGVEWSDENKRECRECSDEVEWVRMSGVDEENMDGVWWKRKDGVVEWMGQENVYFKWSGGVE